MKILDNEIENGDVIKFTARNIPLIFHYGIAVFIDDELYILHNGTKGVRKEKYDEFIKGRTPSKVMTTAISGMNTDEILKKFDTLKDKKYNIFNNDCQDFIEELTGDDFGFKTKQNRFFFTILGVGLIIASFLYFNKKHYGQTN